MSKRLQVILDEEEYKEIQGVARRQRVTLAEWVRQALRQARNDHPGTAEAKLRVIADASRHEFPTAEIEVMLREIEAGAAASLIFIDSNVPMYLVGAAHRNKDRAVAALTQLVRNGERFITDVEVYQEILHRYTAIQRPDAIDAAFDSLDGIADDVLTFGMAEVRSARALLGSVGRLSARDALHVAVMQTAGVSRILSFDDGFDSLPGIERLK